MPRVQPLIRKAFATSISPFHFIRMPDDPFATQSSDSPFPTRSPSDPIALPRTVGRFRIERILGQGGFGVVYLGHDEKLQRRVAIRVPKPQFVEHV
jgi:hypothetical protein